MCGALVRSWASTCDVAAWVGLDAGGGEVELGGVGDPADRDDRDSGVDVVRGAVV